MWQSTSGGYSTLPEFLNTLDAHHCSSLQTLPELLMSLRTLDVHECCSLQSLPELPMSLKTLDVHNCRSLKTLPKLLMSLQTLNVQSCSSLQILPKVATSFEILNAEGRSSLQILSELPPSLKTDQDERYSESLHTLGELPRSLETLNVVGWTSLATLPKLPPFLKYLDASFCMSLKIVKELRETMTRVLFWNCLKLDEYSVVHIELSARTNVMKYANQCLSTPNCHHVENYNYSDYDDRAHHHSYQALYAYPGSSVPEWLEYKTRNDFIIIDLSSAPPSPLLAFIFCFVLCEGEVNKDLGKNRLEVNIRIGDCEGKRNRGNVRMYIEFPSSKIRSDHVCVLYDQRCSSFLNNRVKNQTRFRIQVLLQQALDDALRQGYVGVARFGVSPISTLT